MTRGTWWMLAVLGVFAFLPFLLIGPADAQVSPCTPPCDSHADCYYHPSRGYFCACNGYYTGNGYSCKYSTWRVVLYILGSVIGFVLIFFLCLLCLGYFRQRRDQPIGYPMQPMGNPPYSYPPQAAQMQSTANPAVYAYPPQTTGYPAQTGYPVNVYPPQVGNQASSKIPGPSGTV